MVTGSRLDAEGKVALDSGRNIIIQSGVGSESIGNEEKNSRTGMGFGADSNSISVFAGKEIESTRHQTDAQTVAGSSIKGDSVSMNAGNNIDIIGSDVEADRTIRLDAGNDVNVVSSHEQLVTTDKNSFTRDGLTVTMNHNIGQALDAIGSLGSGDNAVSNASGVMEAMDAMNNVGPSASAFLGQTTTTNTTRTDATTARGSSLKAGEDIFIDAGNNATISGSEVKADRNISIDAENINILSAENTATINTIHDYN